MNQESDRSPEVTKILKTVKDAEMSGISEDKNKKDRSRSDMVHALFRFCPRIYVWSGIVPGISGSEKAGH